MNESSFYDGSYKNNKVNKFFLKETSKLIYKSKNCYCCYFWDEKVIFIVFYVKDAKKKFVKIGKFHLLKKSLTKLNKLNISSNKQIAWNGGSFNVSTSNKVAETIK